MEKEILFDRLVTNMIDFLNHSVNDFEIERKCGAVMVGSVSLFHGTLQWLHDHHNYLNQRSARYWLGLRSNLRREMEEREKAVQRSGRHFPSHSDLSGSQFGFKYIWEGMYLPKVAMSLTTWCSGWPCRHRCSVQQKRAPSLRKPGPGVEATITVDIEATGEGSFEDYVQCIIKENTGALKFKNAEFEVE